MRDPSPSSFIFDDEFIDEVKKMMVDIMISSIGEEKFLQHLPLSVPLWKKADDSSLSSMKEESVMTATRWRMLEGSREGGNNTQEQEHLCHQRQSLRGKLDERDW